MLVPGDVAGPAICGAVVRVMEAAGAATRGLPDQRGASVGTRPALTASEKASLSRAGGEAPDDFIGPPVHSL